MARIDASGISEELQGRLRGLLAVHGHWCARHRSTKWRQNTNHLLLEEMGALVVGAALSDVPRYQAMGRRAAARLAKELDRQTCDGRNWEPTTAYHRFVTEALLVTLSAARRLKDCSASESLEALAEKHVETLQWLCTPGGMMPLVGDDDAGVVLPRSDDWDARQCSEVLELAHELGFNTNVKDGVRIWSDVGMGVLRSEPWHVHLVGGAPRAALARRDHAAARRHGKRRPGGSARGHRQPGHRLAAGMLALPTSRSKSASLLNKRAPLALSALALSPALA